MFLISLDGVLREANNRFYGTTGHSRDHEFEMSWMDFIMESSMKIMEESRVRLVNDQLPWSGELQLKKQSSPVNLHGDFLQCT